MTESEAQTWFRNAFGVSRETMAAHFVQILLVASKLQNLLAASTLDRIWSRHVVDSAQLVPLAPHDGDWVDIGTGAGFPGVIAAICSDREFTLVEPRRKRAEFLTNSIEALGLAGRVKVIQSGVGALSKPVAIISARAVAPLTQIFNLAEASSTRDTLWLLPKGRSAAEEVEEARKTWHGSFHMEQSLTDPDARIVVASDVRRR